jgi:hypothetical protein
MVLYIISPADTVTLLLPGWGTATAGVLLMAGCSAGMMLNELHNNPRDMDNKRFLTQGTVFFGAYQFSVTGFLKDFKNERQCQNIMQLSSVQAIINCFLILCEELRAIR